MSTINAADIMHRLAVRRIAQMCPIDLYDYVADFTEHEGLIHGQPLDMATMRQIVASDLIEIGADAFFANVNGTND